MNSKMVLLIFLGIGALATQVGAESVRLSNYLLDYANNSARLAASLLEREAAEADVKLARVPYPTLRLDLTSPTYSWRRSYTYRYYLEDLYRGYLESKDRIYRLTLSLRQPLPTGGDLSLKMSGHNYRTTFAYSGFPPEIPIQRESADREFLADVGIEIEQPIFGFIEARERLRTEKLHYSKAGEQAKLDSKRVLREGIEKFYGFLIASLNLEIAEAKVGVASSSLLSAEKQFADSILSSSDVLDRRIDLETARLGLAEARANFEEARRSLGLGTEIGFEDLIPEDLNQVAPIEASDLDYQHDPAVREAALDIELARIELSQTRRRRFGTPTLSLWYGFQGLGYDLNEARREFGRNRWGGTFSIGLTFPEPGLGSEIRRAKAKIRSAEAAYTDAIAEARKQMDRIRSRGDILKEILNLKEKKIKLLETRIQLERQKQTRGLVSDEEVFKIDIDLANARISYLETFRDLDLTWLDICCIAGRDPLDLLENRGGLKIHEVK